jgi:putative hydrolase of the HAD superfamily
VRINIGAKAELAAFPGRRQRAVGRLREDLPPQTTRNQFGAVIFDLFGTLVAFPTHGHMQVLCEMATRLGVSPEHFFRLWLDTFPQRAVGIFRTKTANLAHICRTLDIPVDDERLSGAADLFLEFERRHLIPRDDAIETLSRVKDAGLKTGLISDCSPPLPVWPETPFAPLIDVSIFSCEVGMRKPDPQIYYLTCSRLGVPPQHCLYVGDGGSQELTGASRVGMHAVLLRSLGEQGAVRYDADVWHGPSISTLSELIGLLERISPGSHPALGG